IGVQHAVAVDIHELLAADVDELEVAEVLAADVHAAGRLDVRRVGRRLDRAGRRYLTHAVGSGGQPCEAEVAAAIGDRALQHRARGGIDSLYPYTTLSRSIGVQHAVAVDIHELLAADINELEVAEVNAGNRGACAEHDIGGIGRCLD